MDHLFGKLRSTLHSNTPSKKTWRAITQLFYPAYTARRADLVPYADDLLDRTWPDALRAAPQSWLKHLRETGTPHHAWPLVRALQLCTRHTSPQDPLLEGDHLAHITHVRAEAAPSIDLTALLHAPSLRHLVSLDNANHPINPNAIKALLTRHPTLQTLRLGYGADIPLDLPQPELPDLHTLDLSQHHAVTQLAQLLTPTGLPALTALKLRSQQPLPAPLLAQLRALHITTSDPDTLRSLDDATSIDHLSIGSGGETNLRAIAALRHPRPRAISLCIGHEDPLATIPDGWRSFDDVEELTLTRMRNMQTLLRKLLDLPMRGTLRTLRLFSCYEAGGHDLPRILTASPWPQLHTLHIERSIMAGIGADPTQLARAFPNLRHLIIRCGSNLSDQDLRAILDAPWFPDLETFDINSSYYARDASAGHPVIAALDGHQNLRHLGLCSAGLNPHHLAQLARTDLPNLQILRLGKLPETTRADVDQLAQAPWLPQLRWVRLKVRNNYYTWRYNNKNAPLQYLNLKAHLVRHGLPATARVHY